MALLQLRVCAVGAAFILITWKRLWGIYSICFSPFTLFYYPLVNIQTTMEDGIYSIGSAIKNGEFTYKKWWFSHEFFVNVTFRPGTTLATTLAASGMADLCSACTHALEDLWDCRGRHGSFWSFSIRHVQLPEDKWFLGYNLYIYKYYIYITGFDCKVKSNPRIVVNYFSILLGANPAWMSIQVH